MPFHSETLPLLTLSDYSSAYLIDMQAFGNSPTLNNILTQIMSHPNSLVIGYDFDNLQKMLTTHLPEMHFYRNIARYIDAQEYYRHVKND